MRKPRVLNVPLTDLEEPEQVIRQAIDPDRVRELADSMETTGLLQPIMIRKTGDKWKIIAGHRRSLAARMLGWTHIPAIETDPRGIPDIVLALTENTAREQLTPLEEAIVIYDLVVKQTQDLDRVAKMFGHSRAWAEGRLALYDLPKEIRECIHRGTMTFTVGRELAQITDPGYRAYLVEQASNNGCTMKVAQMWRQEWESRGGPTMQSDDGNSERPIYQPPPAAGLECSSCQRLTPLTLLTTMHVCAKCLQPREETNQ